MRTIDPRVALLATAFALPAGLGAQSVLPPFNSSYSAIGLGVMPGGGFNYGGIAFRHDNPDVLLAGAYGSTRIVAIELVRNAQGQITGFGPATVHATVGGCDGGLAYGPGDVLFHTWYGTHALCQIKPGSAQDDVVTPLAPLGVSYSVGACAFTPSGHPNPGRLKLISYSTSRWYDIGLAPDGNGTYSIQSVGAPIQLSGNPEGILFPPANAPWFGGHRYVLVAEWNGEGVVAYQTDAQGDPIPATRQLVLTGISGNAGGAVDPRTGDMLFSGNGGRLFVLRSTATCGAATTYGQGTAGLQGVPALGGSGCMRLGEPVVLSVEQGRPSTFGVLLVGVYPANLPVLGVQLLTSGFVSVVHALDPNGRLNLPLQIPVNPRLGNQHLYLQALYLDAVGPKGLSATPGLDLWIR